jgi:hypothetical protein
LSQNGQRGSLLVFGPHYVFGQNHLCVKILQTGIPLFRVCKSEEFKFPVSRPNDRAILFGRPSVHYSVRATCLLSGPPRQISIIRPDEVFIPSGPHTVLRSFCSSLHLSRRFSSTSGRLPILDQLLISFQVPRKGRSINRSDVRLLKERIAIQI